MFGEAMNRSVYGSRGSYRNTALTSGTYSEYRALPEEVDAWATGDAAEGSGGCGNCEGM
jgi:hypothetical protein